MKVFTKINLLVISVILMVLFALLFTNKHFYKDDMISKKPLAVFADVVFDDSENNSGESGKVYLIDILRFDYFPGSSYLPIENGGYFLSYEIAEGDYPNSYRTYGYELRVIPENNRFRLERRTNYWGSVSRGQEYYFDVYFPPVFYFAGYSDDKNNLGAKIFEYYLKNENNITIVLPPFVDLTNEDFRKMQQ